MARGVKSIRMVKGKYYPKKTQSLTTRVTIQPDQEVEFHVDEWLPNTTEEDKKEDVFWLRQTNDRKIILWRGKGKVYSFKITKKLCGPYHFYVEASKSGNRDYKNRAGMYVRGHCTPLIKSSDWRMQPKGTDIKNGSPIKYGELVYLQLETEGLNGNSITVEIYNQALGDDDYIHTYTNVKVKDGVVLLQIGNTSAWMAKVKRIQNIEEFYIKAKVGNTYIKDHLGDDKHAVYLNVKKELVSNQVKPTTNLTPTKIFKPEVNAERFEPCKFDEIIITAPTPKDGKMETVPVTVFKKGQNLTGIRSTVEKINRTVHFNFNDYSINPQAQKVLNNILGFLLEHKGTTIHMSGYACVIGKEDYNLDLSKKRSDAVKDFFVQGGLDGKRINSVGKGEYNIQSPDDYEKRNEEVYIEARRVDISFTFSGHDADAVVFETIAPSSDRFITLDVVGLDVSDCYRENDKHENKTLIKSPDAKVFEGSGQSLRFPIRSTLSKYNPAPIQYIWPKWNLVDAVTKKRLDSAAIYNTHIHSCRYFSDKNKPSLKIKAYPDIKWNFQLSFNFSNSAAYTHGNLPEYSRKQPLDKNVREIKRTIRGAQSKATASGIESRRMQNSPEMLSKFGIKLEAKWDNEQEVQEIGTEFAEKIRKVVNLMVKYKEIADKVKNTVGGKAKNGLGRPPFMFEVQSPALNANVEWYLEQGKDKFSNRIATVGVLRFKADPLIGASFTIDLLAVASRMHPAIAAMVAGADLALSALKGGMIFEAKFYGKLQFDFKALEINSLSGMKGGSVDLGAEMGVEILFKIEFQVKYDSWFMEVEVALRAEALMNAHFAAKATINSDEKGVYFQPELGFSGLIFTFKAEVVVGGFKRQLSFGNKKEPFLKSDIAKPNKMYIID